jgi:hypothetical protein
MAVMRSIVGKTYSAFLASIMVAVRLSAAQPASSRLATYVVHAGPIARTYMCAPGVAGGVIEEGTLYANLRRGNNRYLLVGYSEPSVLGDPRRDCAAGTESHLVWIHVRNAIVLETQSALYESCWTAVEGGRPHWSGGFCTVEYESFRAPRSKLKATFNSAAPQRGLTIATHQIRIAR